MAHAALSRWLGVDYQRCHLAMFTTYYDTSGTDNQPVVTTVGLFTSVSRWLAFEKEWRAILDEAGVPYVHMKDLVHCNPPYAHLKSDEPRRRALFEGMINLLADGNMRVLGMTLATEDFRKVDKRYALTESVGGPWGLCAIMCATVADVDWRVVEPNMLIGHYHERGEKTGRGRVLEILAETNIDLNFRPKVDPHTGDWFVPFQACDFVAWELRKAIDNLRKGNRLVRRSFGELYSRLDPRLRELKLGTEDSLVRMCERFAHRIPKRDASP